MGLAGFYDECIPNFAAITAHLTDHSNKNKPNKTTVCDPLHEKDASDHGVGQYYYRMTMILENRPKLTPV